MGLCTANGIPVNRARATMQISGCWIVDLVASQPVDPGPVTVLNDSGLTFKGTMFRGGLWLNDQFMRVLPGAGGMGKIAKAKSYRNVSASVIVKDLLGVAGEKMSPTSNAKVLATQFPFYTVNADAVGRCLSALLQDPRLANANWRSLPDGTIFIGAESWPDTGLLAPGDYQDLSELPHQGRAELGFDSPVLTPGVSLEGRHVGAVEHRLDGEKCRTTAWFEDGTSSGDRLKGPLYAAIRTAVARLAFAAPRFARVVASSTALDGSTTLDVAPEDGTFPTLQGVPLFLGSPGESIVLAAGTRVLLEYSAGDPSKPFVRSWGGGETVSQLEFDADSLNLGGPEAVPLMTAPLSIAIETFGGVLTTYVTAIKPIADPSNAATPAMLSGITALVAAALKAVTLNAKGQ